MLTVRSCIDRCTDAWTDCDDLRLVMANKPVFLFFIIIFVPFVLWRLLYPKKLSSHRSLGPYQGEILRLEAPSPPHLPQVFPLNPRWQ
jgi:hypothetical protein